MFDKKIPVKDGEVFLYETKSILIEPLLTFK